MRAFYSTKQDSTLSEAHRQVLEEGSAIGADTLRLALEAAAAGQATFPLRGKAPAISKAEGGHGYKDASRQASRVTALFNRAGASKVTGFGIATGRRSKVVVADVDGPEGVAAARRMGLTSDYIVRTGRALEGWHLYFAIHPGAEVKSFDLAEGIELKAEGCYVVGPGSLHPSGRRYRVVKDGAPSPLPDFVLEAALATAAKATAKPQREGPPVSVDVAGPAIPKGDPGRNKELTRICGRLHDGSRDLEQLTRDLEAINEARCKPPLGEEEVARIAASIHGRPPCNGAPEPTPWVKGALGYLRGVERPIKGMGGSTGWAIYNGLLDHAARYGREHPQGVALSVDMRTVAQLAATNASTVSRWLKRTQLVSVLQKGSGRRGTTVVLHVPPDEGQKLQHSTTRGVSKNNQRPRSVATSALQRTLYRLRWSGGSAKARHGVVKGAARVRQGTTPSREGASRIGKSKAAILSAVVDCEGEVALSVLAERLGRKPASMRAPLRWLVDAGLLVRVRRGYYDAAPDLAERLEDARELGREPEADRLQIAEHARQRKAYHGPVKAEPVPTEEQMREHRDSYPERRRAATERAIAALFRERPEYRGWRVGQITARLVHYIGPDFPRGQLGAPKDHEVEAILAGELRTG